MFYTTLDQIQEANTKFINTFVQNEGVRNAMQDYLSAQTEFVKHSFKVGVDVATTLNKQFSTLLTK